MERDNNNNENLMGDLNSGAGAEENYIDDDDRIFEFNYKFNRLLEARDKVYSLFFQPEKIHEVGNFQYSTVEFSVFLYGVANIFSVLSAEKREDVVNELCPTLGEKACFLDACNNIISNEALNELASAVEEVMPLYQAIFEQPREDLNQKTIDHVIERANEICVLYNIIKENALALQEFIFSESLKLEETIHKMLVKGLSESEILNTPVVSEEAVKFNGLEKFVELKNLPEKAPVKQMRAAKDTTKKGNKSRNPHVVQNNGWVKVT